jgi:hypothetical protein
MPDIPTPSWLRIPRWLDEIAPGAAHAACDISSEPNLSGPQRQRLQRLVSETKPAWHELGVWRDKDPPSEYDQPMLQYELFYAAYHAPEMAPITKAESRKSKRQVASIGKSLAKAAHDLQDLFFGNPVTGMELFEIWISYKEGDSGDTESAERAVRDLRSAQDGLRQLIDFCDYASANIRPVAAASFGKTRSTNARRSTAIHHIAQVCQRLYGSYMLGTVAKLASASLDDDIGPETVRSTLRDPGVKSQKITP